MISIIDVLNNPFATMGVVLGLSQLLRYVDLANPKAILGLRIAYLVSQMAMLLFWTLLRRRISIQGAGNKETVEIEVSANPLTGSPAKTTRLSATEYDLQECGKQMQQLVTGTLFMLVLHYYFNLVQPLFFQIILPWKGLLTQPLVQIHVYGFAAVDALKRPFKVPSPFSELLNEQTAEPQARIEEVKDDVVSAGNASEEPVAVGAEAAAAPATTKKSSKKKARKED